MSTYVSAISSMVDDLRKHDYLEVLNFDVAPPPDGKRVAQVERFLDAKLSKAFRDFYAECNGFELNWRIALDVGPQKLKSLKKLSSDYELDFAESENYRFGCIKLL